MAGYGRLFSFLWLVLSWRPEAKIGETRHYRLSTDHLGPTVTEVVVWLPGMVAADCGPEFSFYI